MSDHKLTAEAIQEMAAKWYRALDVHEPLVSILPMLTDNPEMVFPEVSFTGLAGFEGWYQTVIRLFFDEEHTVKVCEPTINQAGDEAEVKVIVEWKASRWNPPAANSDRIELDADQTWVVKLGPAGTPVVAKYVVNGLTYHPGSATL